MKKRCIIIMMTISIFLIIIFNNNKHDIILKKDGITYALVVDGKTSITFPEKGMYQVETECNGAVGKWDYSNWKLDIEDITGDVSCSITFTTISKEYLNQKVIEMAETEQGNGKVIKENRNEMYEDVKVLIKSDYSDLYNDPSYPWIWNDSEKTWTSSNKGDVAASTESFIAFNPNVDGSYAICYKQSSQSYVDYATIYKNGIEIFNLEDLTTEDFICQNLIDLTTEDTIKVTYKKNINTNSGKDEVTFYIKSINDVSTYSSYRYEGKNPNNYVWFNNELWRMFGAFDENSHGHIGEYLIKIIRDDSLGTLAWNKNESNNWKTSSLKSLLNGAYYNQEDGTNSGYCYLNYRYTGNEIKSNCDYRVKGISNSFRGMIKNVTWYLGGYSSALNDLIITVDSVYNYERGSLVYYDNPTNITGYIGLIYPSDYGYSMLASDCPRSTYINDYSNENCAGKSWLYKYGDIWTIMQITSSGTSVLYLNNNGEFFTTESVNSGSKVNPVLYLDSSVYVLDGDGSMLDPYIIGM